MKKYLLIFLSVIVCLFCFIGCSSKDITETAVSSTADYPASIMVDDKIYLLGQAIPAEIDESSIIGYTTSYTDSFPSKNGETNFNRKLNMPYAEVEGGIAVLYENEWYLCSPKESDESDIIDESEQWDLIPMVMINGELYLDTGKESFVEARCGVMDGEITSTVDGSKKPNENNQSNFGVGYGYQYGIVPGTVEIYMNDKWWIYATEETREEIQFPTSESETILFNDKVYIKSDLSKETIEWLENYNSLSEEEQLAISYIPSELYELCGYPTAEDIGTTEVLEETIIYDGKEYKKSELCDSTLYWLGLSEQEKMLSSYLPPEFMIFEETWGITLTAENVTPEGLTIKCTQSAGEPTGELQTGSWYIVENWTKENGWKEMPYVIEGVGWTSEAWIIPMNDTCEWEVNWEWLYGSLPAGKYRIGKQIDDFRDSGNYDTSIYHVEFELTE